MVLLVALITSFWTANWDGTSVGEVCKRNGRTAGHLYLPFGPVQDSTLFLASDWPTSVIVFHEDQHLILSVTILVEHRSRVNWESEVHVSDVTSTVSMVCGLIVGVKSVKLKTNVKQYSKTLVTWTLKGNAKQLELVGNSSYRSKFQWKVWSREMKFSLRLAGNSSYRGSTAIQRSHWEVNTIVLRKIIPRKQRKSSQVFTPRVTWYVGDL